jgi:hypothetical protein
MSRPKDIEDRLERVLNAWRTLAPDKTFGGMTLAQFETACALSKEARVQIEELQDKMTQAIARRDAADDNTANNIQRVVNGVLADPSEGSDSPLYSAFGYTRRSERKTGLTRKHNETTGKKE